jgi:hypothetical protein
LNNEDHLSNMATTAIREALEPRNLISSLTAGLIGAVFIIVFEISLAVLIFCGELADFVSNGISLMLFGALAIGLIAGLTSSFSGILAGPQDSPAAILALMSAVIIQEMPAAAKPTAHAAQRHRRRGGRLIPGHCPDRFGHHCQTQRCLQAFDGGHQANGTKRSLHRVYIPPFSRPAFNGTAGRKQQFHRGGVGIAYT